MKLPTRVKSKSSFGGPRALSGARRCAQFVRNRWFVWICAGCVSLLLIQLLVFPQSPFPSTAGRHPSNNATTSLHTQVSPLLDGATKLATELPRIYPNGDSNRFACDLPALRYQCDLDKNRGCLAYPQLFPTGELMRNWSPDNVEMPPKSFSSLCRFNISSPYEFALARVFHDMEVPFIAYGIPELTEASRKWTFEYLERALGASDTYKVQKSNSTHFMFFTKRMAHPDATPPYEKLWMRYADFTDAAKTASSSRRHYFYLMLTADDIRTRAKFALHDLSFLDPDHSAHQFGSFFIRDEAFARSKGMRCRFGMPGIITEGHVDAGLNMVAMARGRKRYILSPPSACSCLGLHTSGPSMRHTSIDWGAIVNREAQPKIYDCPATEAMVGEGDVLYIPSYWYHHIVSLDHTIQCNVRSGIIARSDVEQFLRDCGLVGF